MFKRIRVFLVGPVFCVGIAMLFVGAFGWKYVLQELGGNYIDFPSYWVGAVATFNLEVSPYGESFTIVRQELIDTYVHPFIYPPPSLPLFWPAAQYENVQNAGDAFLILNASLTIASGAFAVAALRREFELQPLVWLLIFFLFPMTQATRITLSHGQVNMLALTAILMGIFFARNAVAYGLFLAIAALGKIYLVIAVPGLFARRSWKPLLFFSLTLLFFSVLSLILSPVGLWSDWIEEVLLQKELAGTFSVDDTANVSLVGFCARLGIPVWLGLAIGLVLVLASFSAAIITRQNDFKVTAMLLCLVLLLPSIGWIHYAVFLIPALGYSICQAFYSRNVFWILLSILSSLVLLQNPLVPAIGASGNLALTAVALLLWGGLWLETIRSAKRD